MPVPISSSLPPRRNLRIDSTITDARAEPYLLKVTLRPLPDPCRIVADDHGFNRTVACGQLAKLGYKANTVTNGTEALALVKKIPYEVILMDCQMPEMDGFQATRLNREHQNLPEKPMPQTMEEVGSPDPEPILDLEQINEAVDSDPATLVVLIKMYLEEAHTDFAHLVRAVESNAAAQIERYAHKLAGSSSTCGLKRFAAALRQLETIALQGDIKAIQTAYGQASSEFVEVKERLAEVSRNSIS